MALQQSQIGRRLKAVRKEAQLSQAAVARHLKVDAATVSRWERGTQRIKADSLAALAALYKVPIHSLVGAGENGRADVIDTAEVPRRLGESRTFYQSAIGFTGADSGQEGRVWLQRFALELTEAGADDDFVAWARRFLTSPENFVIYHGGQPEEMTDQQKLRHMKGLADGVRTILKGLRKEKGR